MRKLLALALVAVLLLTYGFVSRLPQQPLKIAPESSYTLTVPAGSSLRATLRQLADDGVLNNSDLVFWYARLTQQTAIKRGEYRLQHRDTVASLLNKLLIGQVAYRSLTLPEGWNLKQIQARLAAEFKTSASNLLAPANYGVKQPTLEGWIFPDTYYFAMNDTPTVIVKQAVQKMQRVLQQQWQLRDSGLPYNSPFELLIMASLIEKETAVASEREYIASVFINRLRKGMKLQTDPTVIYALGAAYDGNLRRSDLKLASPYNTYRIRGLPPGPIAMPGLQSLQAAARPASTPYLYFVAKGNGEHQFSVTLAEHNAAVNRYQRYSREKNYTTVPQAPARQ